MTAVRWVVEHDQDQLGTGGWVEHPDEATARTAAGTAATVWALVKPEVVAEREVELRTQVNTLRWYAEQLLAERDRFREHSIRLNGLGWRLAKALGRVPDGAESVSGDVDEQLSALIAERDSAAQERARLAQRLLAAHEVLAGIGVDEDSCTTLESTVEHVAIAYRAVAASEARAVDEIERLSEVVSELRAEVRRVEAEHDRYRAVVKRVRTIAGEHVGCTELCRPLAIRIVAALSVAEPPGVDSGTSEAVSGASDDVGATDGAVAFDTVAAAHGLELGLVNLSDYRATCACGWVAVETSERYAMAAHAAHVHTALGLAIDDATGETP